MPHLLVQRGDRLDGGVPGIDVHSLFCVGMEVEQSSHEVLNKTQGLTGHIPGFKLKPQTENIDINRDTLYTFLQTNCFINQQLHL